jgi:hypothetical protein
MRVDRSQPLTPVFQTRVIKKLLARRKDPEFQEFQENRTSFNALSISHRVLSKKNE